MSINDELIQQRAGTVALSVQVAVNPTSSSSDRQEAHKYYEDFRTSANPLELSAVGFALSSRTEQTVILAGLQLIEHVAKYKWNELTDRQQAKERLLMMCNGLNPGTATWPSYLQEALSKVIVEIAKREWPQLWPDLFPKLFEIASNSDLALLVLRRMAEDVVTFQLIDCVERRRELSQSLNAIAPEVISTLFKVLVTTVQEYYNSQSPSLKRRGTVCLGCLLPYIEWQNLQIFTQETRISILFALLPKEEFQIEAADCIIQLLERKPLKKEDKIDVVKICLEDDCCIPLLQSIEGCENNLDFLRKVGEIVGLMAPFATEGKVKVENFFTCALKLANKSQAVAVLGSVFAANQYLKVHASSSDLTETPIGKALICLLNAICNKFVSAPPTPQEKDEFPRLKAEFSQMIRSVGKCLPKLYHEVTSWLHSCLNSPTSVQMYQWEALVLVIDAVASSISHEDKEMIGIGLRDLEQCFTKFKSETILELKSIILSTVSALFVFLSLSQRNGTFSDAHLTFMHSILESVFHCFSYENVPYARDIRRHAAALMIKLSSRYPDLLVQSFNFIHTAISAVAPKLSSMEYTTLTESLLITCNYWNDLQKQSAFIQSLLSTSDWKEISSTSESLSNFISILDESGFQEKRILYIKNLTLLHSIIRRVKKSTKVNSVLQSNNTSENSNHSISYSNEAECHHPAYDTVCPVLPVVLRLVKTVHSLLDEPNLVFLMDLSEQERSHILGIHFSGGVQTAAGEPIPASVGGVETEKTHAEKLKVFIQAVVDLTYGILGGAPVLFMPKFYYIPQVAEAYLSFVGWNNSKMNDFRLRGVIRSIFSSFLINCPPAQFDHVVKPFVQNFNPFMMDRLVTRWSAIETENSSGEDTEEKEVVENTSLRLLSKDYVDLLHKLLELKTSTNSSSQSLNGTGTGVEDTMMIGNDVDDNSRPGISQVATNPATGDEPGECGILLMSDPVCFQSIIHLCIQALCWDDSNVCLKASRCILLTWRKIVEQTDIIRATFGTTLRALCVWYENEAIMDCLIKVLDMVFKTCHQSDSTLSQMLKEWGANEQDIQKLTALCHGLKNDKKRKDLYRRMILNNPALEKNRSPKAQWLRGLPQLNFSKSKDARQKSPEIDLSECFSIIHQT